MGILDKIFGRSGNVDEDKLALFVNLLMTLAEVDGNFSEDEGKHITKYIERSAENIKKEKWDRIISKAESLGSNGIEMAKRLSQDEKAELLKEFIALATSDGEFSGEEVSWIVVFSSFIDMDLEKVQNEITKNYDIDWGEAASSLKEMVKKVEEVTGKKIDGLDELFDNEESIDPNLTEDQIKVKDYLKQYKDYFKFDKIIDEMIKTLGSKVYQTISKNAGFVINDDDEIDKNLSCSEAQLRKNFLKTKDRILALSVAIALDSKIEPTEVIEYLIFKTKNDTPKWLQNVSGIGRVSLQILSNIHPHQQNNNVYDEFEEGMIDNGLLNSSTSIFSLFLEGSNRPMDQKLKDNIALFLDTFGYGLFLKQEYKDSVIIHDKSIELSPDCNGVAEHYTNRGKALLKLGNIEGAKRDFEKALEKDENFEEAKKLISTIK